MKPTFVIATFPSKTAMFSWFLKTSDCEVITMVSAGVAGIRSAGSAARTKPPQNSTASPLMDLHTGIATDPHFSCSEQRIHTLAGHLHIIMGPRNPDRFVGPKPTLT